MWKTLLTLSALVIELKAQPEEELIFYDDFSELNLNVWQHEITLGGGGNWEFQYYTNNRTNSYVEDGVLYIKPTLLSDYIGEDGVTGVTPTTLEVWGTTPADQCTSNMFYGCSRTSNAAARIALNPIQSARLRTSGTFSFRQVARSHVYGRVEIEAKLPRGDWLWPALWALPEHNAYGEWPASGEIDIMEARGNAPGYAAQMAGISGGYDSMSSAYHWGPHYTLDRWDRSFNAFSLPDGDTTFADEFHTFGLYWDEKEMYTYVDSDDQMLQPTPSCLQKTNETNGSIGGFDEEFPGMHNPWMNRNGPYDKHFYLVMNVAVGGVSGFFPDGFDGKPWQDTDSDAAMKFWEDRENWLKTWDLEGTDSAMAVRSVKVWQKARDFYPEIHYAQANKPFARAEALNKSQAMEEATEEGEEVEGSDSEGEEGEGEGDRGLEVTPRAAAGDTTTATPTAATTAATTPNLLSQDGQQGGYISGIGLSLLILCMALVGATSGAIAAKIVTRRSTVGYTLIRP
ncbi:unnamed protein product [Chrysoparadoxa australica]